MKEIRSAFFLFLFAVFRGGSNYTFLSYLII